MKSPCQLLLALGLALTLIGCAAAVLPPALTFTPTITPSPAPTLTPTPYGAFMNLVPQVVAVYPHDPEAFTEGLVYDHGVLYESTGLNGHSSLREVDLQTGRVLRSIGLSDGLFGEGLALFEDRLIQLTWHDERAIVYDPATFDTIETFAYFGEGWGLCTDGQRLYMSDGTSTITVRDPHTFAALDTIKVTLGGKPLIRINELEYVGGSIYANVWLTDTIVRIDRNTGNVIEVIEAPDLLTPEQRAAAGDEAVLNGIAYNPDHDTFYLTGKLWPSLFEVKFVQP